MKIQSIWWRKITPNDLFNIEKPLRPGPKGQLHIDIPNVSALHSFFRYTHEGAKEDWPIFERNVKALRDPKVSQTLTFRPRPKNDRYDIRLQNINSDSSERHPAWTSAFGWPAIHGRITSTTEAGEALENSPIWALILRSTEDEYFADYVTSDQRQTQWPSGLWAALKIGSAGVLNFEPAVDLPAPNSFEIPLIGEIASPGPSDSKISSNSENRVTHSPKKSRGQGFGLNAAQRRAVERRAMEIAMDYLHQNNWDAIQDVGEVASYDISAVFQGQVFVIEVKGTTGSGESIILTKNEVQVHKNHFPMNGLFVVSGIELSGPAKDTATGGVLKFLSPWDLDMGRLTPLTFSYEV